MSTVPQREKTPTKAKQRIDEARRGSWSVTTATTRPTNDSEADRFVSSALQNLLEEFEHAGFSDKNYLLERMEKVIVEMKPSADLRSFAEETKEAASRYLTQVQAEIAACKVRLLSHNNSNSNKEKDASTIQSKTDTTLQGEASLDVVGFSAGSHRIVETNATASAGAVVVSTAAIGENPHEMLTWLLSQRGPPTSYTEAQILQQLLKMEAILFRMLDVCTGEWLERACRQKLPPTKVLDACMAAFIYSVDAKECRCESLEECKERQLHDSVMGGAGGGPVKKHRRKPKRPSRVAVHGHNGNQWAMMNWALRVAGDPAEVATLTEGDQQELRSALAFFQPLITTLNLALTFLPKKPRVVFRGLPVSLSPLYKIGERIQLNGFTSTSMVGQEALNFMSKDKPGTYFVIYTHSGALIKDFSHYPEQEEALLATGCTFEVKAKMSRTLLTLLGNKFDVIFLSELDSPLSDDAKIEQIVEGIRVTEFVYAPYKKVYVESRVSITPPGPVAVNGDEVPAVIYPLYKAVTHFVDVVQSSNRMLLLGEGGAGKTSALVACLCHLVAQRTSGRRPLVPVFVSLPAMGETLILEKGIDRHIQRLLALNDSAFEQLQVVTRVVLLLDSLDEVPVDIDFNVTHLLSAQLNPWASRTKAILSCRTEYLEAKRIPYEIVLAEGETTNMHPHNSDYIQQSHSYAPLIYHVHPFDAEDRTTFMKQAAADRIEELAKEEAAKQLLQLQHIFRLDNQTIAHPCLLRIATTVGQRSAFGLHNRYTLYDHFVRRSLTPEVAGDLNLTPEMVQRTLNELRSLAYEMACTAHWQVPVRVVRQRFAKILDAPSPHTKDVTALLHAIPCRCEDLHNDEALWTFWHKTVAEFLTAQKVLLTHEGKNKSAENGDSTESPDKKPSSEQAQEKKTQAGTTIESTAPSKTTETADSSFPPPPPMNQHPLTTTATIRDMILLGEEATADTLMHEAETPWPIIARQLENIWRPECQNIVRVDLGNCSMDDSVTWQLAAKQLHQLRFIKFPKFPNVKVITTEMVTAGMSEATRDIEVDISTSFNGNTKIVEHFLENDKKVGILHLHPIDSIPSDFACRSNIKKIVWNPHQKAHVRHVGQQFMTNCEKLEDFEMCPALSGLEREDMMGNGDKPDYFPCTIGKNFMFGSSMKSFTLSLNERSIAQYSFNTSYGEGPLLSYEIGDNFLGRVRIRESLTLNMPDSSVTCKENFLFGSEVEGNVGLECRFLKCGSGEGRFMANAKLPGAHIDFEKLYWSGTMTGLFCESRLGSFVANNAISFQTNFLLKATFSGVLDLSAMQLSYNNRNPKEAFTIPDGFLSKVTVGRQLLLPKFSKGTNVENKVGNSFMEKLSAPEVNLEEMFPSGLTNCGEDFLAGLTTNRLKLPVFLERSDIPATFMKDAKVKGSDESLDLRESFPNGLAQCIPFSGVEVGKILVLPVMDGAMCSDFLRCIHAGSLDLMNVFSVQQEKIGPQFLNDAKITTSLQLPVFSASIEELPDNFLAGLSAPKLYLRETLPGKIKSCGNFFLAKAVVPELHLPDIAPVTKIGNSFLDGLRTESELNLRAAIPGEIVECNNRFLADTVVKQLTLPILNISQWKRIPRDFCAGLKTDVLDLRSCFIIRKEKEKEGPTIIQRNFLKNAEIDRILLPVLPRVEEIAEGFAEGLHATSLDLQSSLVNPDGISRVGEDFCKGAVIDEEIALPIFPRTPRLLGKAFCMKVRVGTLNLKAAWPTGIDETPLWFLLEAKVKNLHMPFIEKIQTATLQHVSVDGELDLRGVFSSADVTTIPKAFLTCCQAQRIKFPQLPKVKSISANFMLAARVEEDLDLRDILGNGENVTNIEEGFLQHASARSVIFPPLPYLLKIPHGFLNELKVAVPVDLSRVFVGESLKAFDQNRQRFERSLPEGTIFPPLS